MPTALNTIKNVFKLKPFIICPCGFKTTSKRQAKKHLSTHFLGVGDIDFETGAISWE